MEAIVFLTIATLAFVGSHFLLSHPLRRPIVSAIGERAFLAVYSLVAVITFGWLVLAYRAAPETTMLWRVDDVLWAIASIAMLIASILFVGSLIGNPAMPTGGRSGALPDTARGVFAVTRHPMMWAFAIWGFVHIAVYPTAANIVLSAGIILLALFGAAFQDAKKRQLQPDLWPAWEAKTSYLPFAAVVRGTARLGGFGAPALLGGAVFWLAASWAHIPLAGWAAGIWRWM